MKSYAYLLIDFFTLLIPLLFSFHPKLKFHKRWSAFFPAMLIVGALFLVWDELFTQKGIWGFSPDYLIGLQVYSLPLEEILFFVCIPYACVFTFHCLKVLQISPLDQKWSPMISTLLILLLATLLFFHAGKWYTTTTFTLLITSLIYFQYVKKWTNLAHFYFVYAILLIPFGITNGILTGSWLEQPIVWYNDQENMNTRIGTIPFEDIFYGMLLILWNVFLLELFSNKSQSNSSVAG